MSEKNNFFILSGPSGVGKTVFLKKILEEFSNLKCIASYTTRKPREGEKEGETYFFVSPEEFQKLKEEGELLEWEEVHGHFYATAKKEVERVWSEGGAIIKDLDVKGFLSVKKIYPHATGIFIHPPSLNELKNRLQERGQESEEDIKKRLSIASGEIAKARHFDFQITNDEFVKAFDEFKKIIQNKI